MNEETLFEEIPAYDRPFWICTDDITEEQKKYFENHFLNRHMVKFYVQVEYTPSCGCEVVLDVLLDRYPMSLKIHTTCPNCKKGILASISDPVQFYLPYIDKSIPLEELINCVLYKSRQKPFLIEYIKESNRKNK